MKKILVFICSSVFILSTALAQENIGDMIALAEVPESVALIKQAKTYTSAVVNSQYENIAAQTHDDIIAMGGGVDFLIKDLKTELQNLEAQGLKYASSDVGNHPEFVKSTGEIQTIVPVKFHLMMNAEKVESWVNLFASSTDEGLTWKFVNLEKFDEASFRAFVKNVSTELVYPN